MFSVYLQFLVRIFTFQNRRRTKNKFSLSVSLHSVSHLHFAEQLSFICDKFSAHRIHRFASIYVSMRVNVLNVHTPAPSDVTQKKKYNAGQHILTALLRVAGLV